MSVQTNIEFNLKSSIDIRQFIKLAFDNKWTMNDNNKILFLLNDDFDWDYFELNQIENIYSLIDVKVKNRNIVGFSLINEELNSGGLFHFYNDKKIVFSYSINRYKLLSTKITDFNTILAKLYILFEENIESIICEDIY